MLDCVDAMSRFWNLLLIINASWYPEPIAKCQNGKGERIHTKVRRCGLRRSSSPLGSKVEAIFVDAAFAFVLFISFVVCLCSLCRSNYRAFGVSFPLHYNAGARCKFVNFRIYIHWPCLDQKIILIKKLGLFIGNISGGNLQITAKKIRLNSSKKSHMSKFTKKK